MGFGIIGLGVISLGRTASAAGLGKGIITSITSFRKGIIGIIAGSASRMARACLEHLSPRPRTCKYSA